MPEIRRKYDQVFREGAVRVVRETGKSVAQVAEDLGIPKGTLANWVAADRVAGVRSWTRGGSTPSGCASWRKRSPSCAWSVMCSSDPWSFG
jgi:transposase-like protein